LKGQDALRLPVERHNLSVQDARGDTRLPCRRKHGDKIRVLGCMVLGIPREDVSATRLQNVNLIGSHNPPPQAHSKKQVYTTPTTQQRWVHATEGGAPIPSSRSTYLAPLSVVLPLASERLALQSVKYFRHTFRGLREHGLHRDACEVGRVGHSGSGAGCYMRPPLRHGERDHRKRTNSPHLASTCTADEPRARRHTARQAQRHQKRGVLKEPAATGTLPPPTVCPNRCRHH
jgi:hypothetical protein